MDDVPAEATVTKKRKRRDADRTVEPPLGLTAIASSPALPDILPSSSATSASTPSSSSASGSSSASRPPSSSSGSAAASGSGVRRRFGKEAPSPLQEQLSSKWHNAAEISQLDASGVALKTGKFTRREDEILRHSVDHYLHERDLTLEDLSNFLYRKPPQNNSRDARFKSFWKDICGQLRERSLQSLYAHLRRQHHPGNHLGAFTAQEDETLRRLVVMHGTQWSLIGGLMGRMPENCRDRYREIANSEPKGVGLWTPAENEQLRAAIMALPEARNGIPPNDIPWTQVAKAVRSRSPHQCRVHWYSFMSIREHKRESAPVWDIQDDLALIDRMIELQYEDESEIQWPTVAKGALSAWGTDRCRERWLIIKKSLDNGARILRLDALLDVLSREWSERRKRLRAVPRRQTMDTTETDDEEEPSSAASSSATEQPPLKEEQ